MKKTVIVMPVLFCSIMAIMLGGYFNMCPAIGAPITEWEKAFGGTNTDKGSSVLQTTDGGFIIAGTTSSYGEGYSDIYLMKTDADGNEIWYNQLSVSGASSVQQTTDGGFILTGNGGLVKTDANGNEIWVKDLGNGPLNALDMKSVQQTTDRGYIVAGTAKSVQGIKYDDVYLIKVAGTAAEDCATYDVTTKRIHIPLLDAGQLGKFEVILGPPHNIQSANPLFSFDTTTCFGIVVSYDPSTEALYIPWIDAGALGKFNVTLGPSI